MHFTLHLTGRCNLRCKYCYASSHGEDMSFETVQATVALAREILRGEAPEQSLGLIFFGGEPLLMRDLIVRAMRHCREIEQREGQLFHFKITTNGLLLDEEFLTSPDTKDIFVALSHDGVAAAHDEHRVDAKGVGSFERVDAAAELLLKHKPYAPAMLVVTPRTVAHYADSIEHLFGRGFMYLICSLDYSAEWTPESLAELKRQYQRLADWYYRETRAESKFYFSPFEVKMSSHIFPGSCRAERCELGRRQISVAPNGKLYPCVQFVGDGSDDTYAIGHVTTGINEAQREALYQLNGEEKDTCADCAIRERCNHFCGCLNKQATGRVDTVSPVLCAHERIILPIVDKLAARLYKDRNALFIQKHYNDLYPLLSLIEDRGGNKE